MDILRSEHPNPNFKRENWLNLNGVWDFEIDNSVSGVEREFFNRKSLDGKITVPFCPESILSGVHNTDFMNCVWYLKKVTVPEKYRDKRVMLHFGACDYRTIVYINGKKIGEHVGGYTPFNFDITGNIDHEFYITVCAYDNVRSGSQPIGKQCPRYNSSICSYTRTTGIWQTVWLEFVDETYIKSIKITPSVACQNAVFQIKLNKYCNDSAISVKAFYENKEMGYSECKLVGNSVTVTVPLNEAYLWEVGIGRLYDVQVSIIKNGKKTDTVKTYFGLREVGMTENYMTINGKPVFGRFVLDQGFYPDGIYTARTEEELKNDILYSIQLGFNGARLHQKVFEPLYLYWADKLGYMVWGEYANWGMDISSIEKSSNFINEWLEAMERDYSHPSVIGWCPLNETWDYDGRRQENITLQTAYRVTKSFDSTRPCIDTSGNFHVETDIFDLHDYIQDTKLYKEIYSKKTKAQINAKYEDEHLNVKGRQFYDGQPIFISEYGGIKWSNSTLKDAWGYGEAPETEQEFIERYKGLTEAMLDNPEIMGFCYTQLYDVEQEVNGLMTYDRKFKFDPQIFKKINNKKSPYEK